MWGVPFNACIISSISLRDITGKSQVFGDYFEGTFAFNNTKSGQIWTKHRGVVVIDLRVLAYIDTKSGQSAEMPWRPI